MFTILSKEPLKAMAPVKCNYRNCYTTNKSKSLFSFPVDEDTRLYKWIKNSGNNFLKTCTREELRHRFICENHFDTKDVLKDPLGTRLTPNAVPLYCNPNIRDRRCSTQSGTVRCQFTNCRNTARTHSLFCFPKDPDRLRIWIQNSGNANLKKIQLDDRIHHRYVCEDHFNKQDVCRYGERNRLSSFAVPRPYNSEENNIQTENDELDLEESRWQGNTDSVEVFGSLCMECKKTIIGFGFQWWCLQCGGLRCSLCIIRMTHRPHFVLRLPANTRPKQVEIAITAIQKELQLGSFLRREEGEDSDQSDEEDKDLTQEETAHEDELEQILKELPVKAEPPDEEEDPLAECLNNHSLNTQPRESPSIDCSFFTEHRLNNQFNDFRLNENSGLETPHVIKSYRRTRQKESQRPLGLEDSIDRSSETLGLVNSSEYELGRKNSSLDNRKYSSSTIDYQPKQSVGPKDLIDYQQIETTLGLEDSFESHSQTLLGLHDFYDQSDCDDIRHSASLHSAPVGPVSLFVNGALNPKQTALELSGSGSSFGGSSLQSVSGLQSLMSHAQGTTDKDLYPPSNKRIRVLNVEMDLDYTKTPEVTNIDHRDQPTELVHLTEDALNFEMKGPNNDSAIRKNTENKRKLTDTIKQNIDDIKTQEAQFQVCFSHKKRSTIKPKNNQDIQMVKSINSTEDHKNESNKMQQSRNLVYSTHTKADCGNTAIREIERSKQNEKTKEDPINDIHITQRLTNSASVSHEDNQSTNNIEQQNELNKTRQVLIKAHNNQTDVFKRKDNNYNKPNTAEDPKSNPNQIQEPQILVYSTHKKLNCTETSDSSQHKNVSKIQPTTRTENTKQDNEITTQFQVFSTHKPKI